MKKLPVLLLAVAFVVSLIMTLWAFQLKTQAEQKLMEMKVELEECRKMPDELNKLRTELLECQVEVEMLKEMNK